MCKNLSKKQLLHKIAELQTQIAREKELSEINIGKAVKEAERVGTENGYAEGYKEARNEVE